MEQTLDRQICNVAHQLWLRGLISGDDGLISAELHRRRYLVTPPGLRRSDLKPQDLVTVDIGGVTVDGQISLDTDDWLPHRLAYQRRANPSSREEKDPVRATVLARPPMTLALLRKRPNTQTLQLMGLPPVGIVDVLEETAIKNAVAIHQCVAVRDTGLLCVGPDLTSAVNSMESIEHAATVELACE